MGPQGHHGSMLIQGGGEQLKAGRTCIVSPHNKSARQQGNVGEAAFNRDHAVLPLFLNYGKPRDETKCSKGAEAAIELDNLTHNERGSPPKSKGIGQQQQPARQTLFLDKAAHLHLLHKPTRAASTRNLLAAFEEATCLDGNAADADSLFGSMFKSELAEQNHPEVEVSDDASSVFTGHSNKGNAACEPDGAHDTAITLLPPYTSDQNNTYAEMMAADVDSDEMRAVRAAHVLLEPHDGPMDHPHSPKTFRMVGSPGSDDGQANLVYPESENSSRRSSISTWMEPAPFPSQDNHHLTASTEETIVPVSQYAGPAAMSHQQQQQQQMGSQQMQHDSLTDALLLDLKRHGEVDSTLAACYLQINISDADDGEFSLGYLNNALAACPFGTSPVSNKLRHFEASHQIGSNIVSQTGRGSLGRSSSANAAATGWRAADGEHCQLPCHVSSCGLLNGGAVVTSATYLNSFQGQWDVPPQMEHDPRQDSANWDNGALHHSQCKPTVRATAGAKRSKRVAPKLGEGTTKRAKTGRKTSKATQAAVKVEEAEEKEGSNLGSGRRPACTQGSRALDKGKSTSKFRGVTRHRWTGRYEAHLWDSSVERVRVNNTGRRRGKQVYLGGYADEVEAAKAYDKAALKYWGPEANLNFQASDYKEEMEELNRLSNEAAVAVLRRSSSGFSRGASKFRGVTKHHMHGKWEARIGRVDGNRYLYLGTFGSEEEAAQAYDRAAIKHRGPKAVTNFKTSDYDSMK